MTRYPCPSDSQGMADAQVRAVQPPARGLQIELGSIMTNNSEFEISRWEYEGGSIGRQEIQPDKPIAAQCSNSAPARNPAGAWLVAVSLRLREKS